MTKLSPSQLRAARALLNLSQASLSKLSGISEPTLHRFENGANEPETRTVNKLLGIFDQHGVEFLENQGVRFKPDNVEVYNGLERFYDFYDFLYEHLNKFGGDVSVSIYDETSLYRYRGKDPYLHMRRMQELLDKKKLRSFRILTTISDFKTYGYATFRWLPKQAPTPVCFYAFGDCLALMSLVNQNSPHIVVMHSGPMAEGYRQGFDVQWQLGQKPPSQAEINKMLSKQSKERRESLLFSPSKKG